MPLPKKLDDDHVAGASTATPPPGPTKKGKKLDDDSGDESDAEDLLGGGGGGGGGGAAQEQAAPAFERGDIVMVTGLTSDAGRKMNGIRGVVSKHETTTGRFVVKLYGVERLTAVREANLIKVDKDTIQGEEDAVSDKVTTTKLIPKLNHLIFRATDLAFKFGINVKTSPHHFFIFYPGLPD